MLPLTLFAGSIFLFLGIFETTYPTRPNPERWDRLAIHGSYFIFNQIVVISLFKLLGLGLTLPDRSLSLLSIIIFFLLFDLFQYLLHRLFHSVPWLWAIHRVHHSDHQVDISTTLRFHPLQLFLGRLAELFLLSYFLPDIRLYIIYVYLFYFFSFFHHSNISVPAKWERWLAPIFITQKIHRPHHEATNKPPQVSFGAIFSIWDRLFGTLPRYHAKIITFGVAEEAEPFSLKSLFHLSRPT